MGRLARVNELRKEGLPKTALPPLTGTHTRFALVAAAFFSLLYTETGAFSVRTAGTRDAHESGVLLVLASLLIFGGFVASLVLPLRSHEFPKGTFTDARPALHTLVTQVAMGSLLFLLCSVGALVIYVYLVWPNLVSTYNLIKDVFIYSLIAVLYYHGLVGFVRYLTFLYHTKMDNATKVMVTEGILFVITLVMGLYLLTLDVMSLARVSDPTGIIGLHIAVRDIWVTIVILFAYGWHLNWVADH